MGKAKRGKAERRASVSRLQELVAAGDPDALVIAASWHELPRAERSRVWERLAARRRVLDYRAAGAPYGDNPDGYRRWRRRQGLPDERARDFTDWDVSRAFDVAGETLTSQLKAAASGEARGG